MGQESKLGPETLTSEVFPKGYTVYRKDKRSGKAGVFLAVTNTIPSEELETTAECETVWAKIQAEGQKNIYVGSFYRIPDDRPVDLQLKELEELNTCLKELPSSAISNTTILGGDFNAGEIVWDEEGYRVKAGAKKPTMCKKLLEVVEEHGLSQMQKHPTREDALLDLFLTNNPTLVKTVNTVPGITDHDMLVIDQDIKPVVIKSPPRKIYKYSKADWPAMKVETASFSNQFAQDWQQHSVDGNWDRFKEHMFSIMNKFIPSRLSSSRKNLPWFSRGLRRQVRKKAKLYNKAKKSGKAEDWARYRTHKKSTERETKKAQWSYVNNELEKGLAENNTKPFWRYVKDKKCDSNGVAPLRDEGKLHTDDQTKARLLNKQFKSVQTKQDPNSSIPSLEGEAYPDIDDLYISESGVEKLLKNINVNKASGPDAIPNQLLKHLATEISSVLTIIFRQSLDTGKLPSDWRNANITPLFKKGDKHMAVNYRPVSLTCVCSKLMEHIICSHIRTHYDKYNALTTLQHGFRTRRSCVTQLLITTQDLISTFDRKEQIDMIILDFSKAFDVVPHYSLMNKLKHYGVRGKVNIWINEFLTNRSQRVVVNGTHSESVSVDSGVPQGTVLGPLLFLTFINDLPDVVMSQVRLFADDCLLYRTIKTIDDQIRLQDDLYALQHWSEKWGMRFNAKKCYVLRMSRHQTHSKGSAASATTKPDLKTLTKMYELSNCLLKTVSDNPYLGLQIHEDLTWDTHIQQVCSKANRSLGFLKRNLKRCPQKLKELSYLTLVRSITEYGCAIWDPYQQHHIKGIEQIQRRAARFVKRDYNWRSKVSQMLDELKWPPLELRRKRARLILMYQIVNNRVDVPVDTILKKPTKSTRSQTTGNYQQLTTKTDTYKYSFFPRTIKDWNALPPQLKDIPTVEAFKTALDSHLF